jgi:hypothetical protein
MKASYLLYRERNIKYLSLLSASMLLFFYSFAFCKDTIPVEIKPSFRFYFVDEEINVLDKALSEKINEIKLQKEPALTEKDIKAYHWKTHTIELTKEGFERLKKMIVHGKPDGEEVTKKDLFTKGMNKVFVVVVNEKRAYLGRTTSMLSSFIGTFPSIDISWLDPVMLKNADKPENSIRINKGKIEEGEEDVRELEWIKASLEELKLLK